MAHGYHTLQNWQQWLSHDELGEPLLHAEQAHYQQLLESHYGKHALLIGVPAQMSLFKESIIPYHTLVTNLHHAQTSNLSIETDLDALPIQSGSVDVVALPHTLELIETPRQLLTEACRIVKADGLIVIVGFRPYGAWSLWKYFQREQRLPWAGNFISPLQIMTWLKLADFEVEQSTTCFYRPPCRFARFQRLAFLEKWGKWCFPRWGSVYVIVARAKVIPLTPIRMKWKQNLAGIRISSTISGHIAS